MTNQEDEKPYTLSLNPGERLTILFLLNSFTQPERTHGVMRKTKRIKHAIGYKSMLSWTVATVIDKDDEGVDVAIDKDSLDFLMDVWEKFAQWPTAMDEWIDTSYEKMRVARLS